MTKIPTQWHLYVHAYPYLRQHLPPSVISSQLQQCPQHLASPVSSLQIHKSHNATQMINPPKPFLLPLRILARKPRQSKHLSLLRLLCVRRERILRFITTPIALDIRSHVLGQRLPQHSQESIVAVWLSNFGIRYLLPPELLVESIESCLEVRGVLEVDIGKCPIGFDHVDGEAWCWFRTHGHGEDRGPSETFAVAVFRFVSILKSRQVVRRKLAMASDWPRWALIPKASLLILVHGHFGHRDHRTYIHLSLFLRAYMISICPSVLPRGLECTYFTDSGVMLPVAFINPPRNMGIGVTAMSLNAGELRSM